MLECIVQDRLLHLRNDHVSYIIYLLEGGVPAHMYFGARLESFNPASVLRRYDLPVDGSFSLQGMTLDHVPHEYPSFGLGDLRQGVVSIRRHDGTRSLDLRVTKVETVEE